MQWVGCYCCYYNTKTKLLQCENYTRYPKENLPSPKLLSLGVVITGFYCIYHNARIYQNPADATQTYGTLSAIPKCRPFMLTQHQGAASPTPPSQQTRCQRRYPQRNTWSPARASFTTAFISTADKGGGGAPVVRGGSSHRPERCEEPSTQYNTGWSER